ncbi:MAG: DUF177 domain-containing protein [Saprospiraceae bacterium]|nr:DUF177 domain-containing protein [Saprospiraceae bacterium]
MKVLEHFSIPYQGLKNELHTFHFQVDEAFFHCFENALVGKGEFEVELELDKRPDMAIANFSLTGHVVVPCNRCLEDFELPIETDFTLHIKYGDNDSGNDEVIFIDPDTSKVNFAQPIYEWICVSLPMVTVHEDIEDCDPEMIKKLKGESDDDDDDNIWSGLKKMNLDD